MSLTLYLSGVLHLSLEKEELKSRDCRSNSPTYEESIRSYFGENVQLRPICIIQPLTTQDTATVLRILTTASPEEPWLSAVRSGGYSLVVGASDIEPGITIDLSMMDQTSYNASSHTVSIQSGARWASVYEALHNDAIMVPGSRSSAVGVGGFLLGGGESFYAAQVGLSCDSVLEYEVVLGSGEVIIVNKDSYPDLFRALKGGSNNFGIVTMFTLVSFPSSDIWGGTIVHDSSVIPQYMDVATRFTDSLVDDPSAAWVGVMNYDSSSETTMMYSVLAYTKPVARPNAFRDFYQLPNITDTLRIRSVLDMTAEGNLPTGYRHVVHTGTYLNRNSVLAEATTILAQTVRSANAVLPGKAFSIRLIVQPWVPLFWKDNEKHGGYVLCLERFDSNMLTKDARERLDQYAKKTGAYNEYIYLNYAAAGQSPLEGYGSENVAFLQRVARKHDPAGVFQRLVPGGFKISNRHSLNFDYEVFFACH
ncbi:hypothetical protein BJY04DRAFT_231249 [Aspergillus karnatakaensis]|uniref:FAD-binding oxidoreductase n=1 Tax=Aspergillus karnatakaensis TaxID=1810916 RepID=UPI003CCDC7A2